MTQTQYEALLEVAENGERFAPQFLNIRPQTIKAIVARGWVAIENGCAVVTVAGWDAAE